MWKIQFIIAINFISSKHNDEEGVMHSMCDDKELMIYDNVDKVTEELFESFPNKYKILNTNYKCHKINPNQMDYIQILLII